MALGLEVQARARNFFYGMSNVIPPGTNNDTVYTRDNSPLSISTAIGHLMALFTPFYVRAAT